MNLLPDSPWPRRAVLVALAGAAGALHYLSFAPVSIWPAGIAAMALLFYAFLQAPKVRDGLLVGFTWSAATALFSLPWIGSFVGAVPYVALAIFLATISLPTAWLIWWLAHSTLALWLRLLGMAALVVSAEALLARWPFGGFPWLRLAWGQVDGPLSGLVAIGGTALVSFAVAVLGAAVVAMLQPRSGAVMLVASLVAVAILPLAQPLPATSAPNLQVAVVQGNVPRLGLEFNAQRRAVLANHAEATRELADQVRAGRAQQPDVVIWPENSADVSPFRDATAARIIDQAARSINAPIVVGTFTYDDGVQNTMVVWSPRTGPGERHEKIYLQPFGETMPMRELLRRVSPLVDLAGDMTPGSGDGVVAVPLSRGSLALGLATCFEVVFDGAYRRAVAHGATLLATPTNNATFGFTDMTYQQLAMSRMRAMEFQRATAVAATSGVSAIIGPDGQVASQSEIFERKVLTDSLPQYDHLTVAARYGQWFEFAIVLLGIVIVSVAWRRRVLSDRPD